MLMKIYCPICREELISTGEYPPKYLSPSRCENDHEFMVIIALGQTWIQVTTTHCSLVK